MTKLFLITYESAHWCGASDTTVVVHADSADEALMKAESHMEETMWEMFADEYMDDGDMDVDMDESKVSVTSVEEFNESHDRWKYFKDPSQSQFYPEIL